MNKKVEIIEKFDIYWLFQFLSIAFNINLIYLNEFKLFDLFWAAGIDLVDLDLDDEFGSKKSIKSQLDHDLSQNLALDRFDRRSLLTRKRLRVNLPSEMSFNRK